MRLIAQNTFLGFRRKKIFSIFFFSYVFLFAVGLFLGSLALSEQQKIIVDFLLMGIELLGVVWILFFASSLLSNEKKYKTHDLVHLKLKRSYHFFLGKFLGFVLLLALFVVLVALLFSVFFLWKYGFGQMYLLLLLALLFVFVKLLVLLTIVIFFSLFLAPISSLFVSLFVYVLSHSLAFLKYYYSYMVVDQSVFLKYLMSVLYYILPNFGQLSLKDALFVSVDFVSLGSVFLLHIGYIFVLLFLGILVYSKRVSKFI